MGLVVGLILASPWYVTLLLAGRTDALHELLVRQNVSRFLDAWDHQQPWWYYLKYFWLTFAPWSWFVPVAAVAALRRSRDDAGRPLGRLLPWVWLLAPLIFFSLSESKREPYMLPAAPAVAWLAASILEPLRRRNLSPGLGRACATIAGVLGGILLLTGLWVAWPGTVDRSPVPVSAPVPAAVVLVGGALVLAAALSRRGRHRLPLAVLAAFAGLYTLVAVYLHPVADGIKSHRSIALELRDHVPRGHPIRSYFGPRWYLRGGYAFYLGQSLPDLKDAAGLHAAWEAHPELCVVTEGEELRQAMQELAHASIVFEGRVGSRRVRLVCRDGLGGIGAVPNEPSP
jgi:4-amino-4-deoxy-L-arabinose transferase-like glycosyltransferase